MSTSSKPSINDLREALLELKPTGHDGFEGLLATALCAITGVPMRLAASGLQFGLDGKATYKGDGICFEAKRYDNNIPRTEVISKVAELPKHNPDVDLWILGASTNVKTQLADEVEALAADKGVAVLILDWPETNLPPLAVALAMGGENVQKFLKSNIKDARLRNKGLAALQSLDSFTGFEHHAERLRQILNAPTIGFDLARKANTAWLEACFSNRKTAKRYLGQPLAPAETGSGARARANLMPPIQAYLAGKPENAVLAVIGQEGNGKSWAVILSWLAEDAEDDKPLLIFLPAEDFTNVRPADLELLLIEKLIAQTADTNKEIAEKRWRRRFEAWRRQPSDTPRLIVVFDGLNQRPKIDWARLMEAAAVVLQELSGRLIFTARIPYFRERICGRLTDKVIKVEVPEWTDAERNEILVAHGIDTSKLHSHSAQSLRNPRLLGIALELIERKQVDAVEELTVSRLLFEHMRASERDAPEPQPVLDFARTLRDHANEVLSRVTAQQRDDLRVFDGGLEAVANERFFRPLNDDPTRYELTEDGLTLALGFSVIGRLCQAERNSHDLDATIATIIEPIAALDRTAEIILAAITVAGIDDRYSDDIVSALVRTFTDLQNPNEQNFAAFSGIARQRPAAFMGAAMKFCLDGVHHSNADWVEYALIEASSDPTAWESITDEIRLWLERFSFAVGHHIEKAQDRLDSKLKALSDRERNLLNGLHHTDSNLSQLSQLAIHLLAGKELAPFADSLVKWCFAVALNGSNFPPYKEFLHLVRFNRCDWRAAREALLRESALLGDEEISSTGKWALVYVLRATGDPDDGQEAKALVEELTIDREHVDGWRLIEKYCGTDPCDPQSRRPLNISQTAANYSGLNVSSLRLGRGQSGEDHIFEMARTGLARFEPDIVIEKHREFAADVISRTGLPLRQGLYELRAHNALITREQALALIADHRVDHEQCSEDDKWIIHQYEQLIAFPLLTAEEQADALADSKLLHDTISVLKPLAESDFEARLKNACSSGDELSQFVLLIIAAETDTPLSKSARDQVKTLSASPSTDVRTQALSIIARRGDSAMIAHVAQSGWRADDNEESHHYENWYGSIIQLKAARAEIISHEDALNRISPQLYGRAATMLGDEAASEIGSRIDAAIGCAVGLSIDMNVPDIQVQAPADFREAPPLYRISEKRPVPMDAREALQRMNESDAAYADRQRRNHEAFEAFCRRLSSAKARIILDYLTLEEFKAIVDTNGGLATKWFQLFMGLQESALPLIHNVCLMLAHALSEKRPEQAISLFRRLKNIRPFVNITFGSAGVGLESAALWSGPDDSSLYDLRIARLDEAQNDANLAKEVLAALQNGKANLIEAYVTSRLRAEEPAMVARALMVSGFSDKTGFNDTVLDQHKDTTGMIGEACEAALYAYDRNKWARHWYGKMTEATDPAEFWRYAVLFAKIVDGRFSLWREEYVSSQAPFDLFGSSLNNKLSNRKLPRQVDSSELEFSSFWVA